jgi:hypothetical protein
VRRGQDEPVDMTGFQGLDYGAFVLLVIIRVRQYGDVSLFGQ